jgi:hypothetical protein
MGYHWTETVGEARYTGISFAELHCKAIVFDWQFKFAKL